MAIDVKKSVDAICDIVGNIATYNEKVTYNASGGEDVIKTISIPANSIYMFTLSPVWQNASPRKVSIDGGGNASSWTQETNSGKDCGSVSLTAYTSNATSVSFKVKHDWASNNFSYINGVVITFPQPL